jgi:uncharacterized membrane protein
LVFTRFIAILTGAFLRRDLRLIYASGIALLAAWAVTITTWGILRPDPYADGWRLVAELAFVGRAVNIADGTQAGFSNLYLWIQSGIQDIAFLLILYPLAVAAFEHGMEGTFLGNRIARVRRTAERHRPTLEPFGAVGLFVFVFVPFWSTGALIGSVVGYLTGLRTATVLVICASGHLASVGSLIWFFDITYAWMVGFNASAARFLPLYAFAFLAFLWTFWKAATIVLARRARPIKIPSQD